ncbi:hypothetical protein T310_9964, partial [Rasamsonia emersonii CBS 393.64]
VIACYFASRGRYFERGQKLQKKLPDEHWRQKSFLVRAGFEGTRTRSKKRKPWHPKIHFWIWYLDGMEPVFDNTCSRRKGRPCSWIPRLHL